VKASLFVSTYEMPHHLRLVLAALSRQTFKDFEILLCDDGSGAETRAIIEEFAKTSSIPLRHFWQEHQGFRKCRILNQAAREARGEIVVFLDGDCVPHRDYVGDHVREQEEGYYLAGRRVELGQELSQKLTPQNILDGYFDWPRPSLLWSSFQGETENLQRSFRVSSNTLRKILKMNRVVDLKGCNYSIPRKALEAINGFDENYEGYGREDTDVEIRLQNLGLKIKSMKGLAIQFHVWHPRREFTPANDDRLEKLKISGRIKALKGMLPG
jgi:glycosyltransferase involved in cell wall biosynthesis